MGIEQISELWNYEAFPFDEIRDKGGDYFNTREEAKARTGCEDSQIWSVIEGDDDSIVWGAPHHTVNRLGYCVTKEKHDGRTYYVGGVS